MNNIKKFVSYITEEITSIPAEAKNIHYTNITALISMLKDGKILGSDYTFKTNATKSIDKKHGSFELATIRNTGIKNVESNKNNESENLSDNIDTVKISLYTDRIRTSVRGIKKQPIAELPQESKSQMELMKKNFEKKYSRKMPSFKANRDFLKRYTYAESTRDEKTKKEVKSVEAWCLNHNYPKESVYDICKYYKEKAWQLDMLIHREREERFTVGYDGLPLDPNLMKIEIINFPSKLFMEDYIIGTEIANKEVRKDMYERFAKRNKEAYKVLSSSDPKLVIRNSVFNKLLETFKQNYINYSKKIPTN